MLGGQDKTQDPRAALAAALENPMAALADRCYSDFAFFCRVFWRVVNPQTALAWNWHLDLICDRMSKVARGELRKLIINIPPGMAKTIFVLVLYPAWRFLRKPGYRVLCASHKQTLVNESSRKCRDVIESPLYRQCVEELARGHRKIPAWEIRDDQNQVNLWSTTQGGQRLSFGRDAAVIGFRGDEVLIDDPIDAANARSGTELVKACEWVKSDLSTRVHDKRTSAHILVMQRLAEDDPTNALIKEGGWHLLKLAMRFDPAADDNAPDDPRTAAGELLFPARWPAEVVADMENSLEGDAAAQLDQDPSRPKTGTVLWDNSWLQTYHTADLPDILPNLSRLTISIDANAISKEKSRQKKKKGGPDFFVAQVWGCDGPDRYLLPKMERGQYGLPDQLDAIKRLLEEYPDIREIIVELGGAGPSIVDTISIEMAERGITVTPQPTGRDSKESRLQAVAPQARDGHVFVPEDAPWMPEYLAEFRRFPRVKHDDQVDATSQALLVLRMTPAEYRSWLCWVGGPIMEARRARRGDPS